MIHLTELEEAAKAAGKGKHGPTPSRREVEYDVTDADALLKKTYPGIIEHVINGSTLRVAIETGPSKYQMITLMISGIRCPGNGEPFGDEARFYTESRLLQKDIQVRLEALGPGTQSPAFHGSVTAKGNNIAEHLVREGMAKCMDRTLTGALNPEKLRAAETEAKSKKLRLWKDYKQQVRSSADSFEAKVIEVINADALNVQNVETNEVKKIFLASVRAPPRPENEKVERVLYDVPFMFEAREFLRTRLIGKRVKVRVDYTQPKTDKFAEKVCATVLVADGGINVAEALIARGLATVVRYRPDDESRSSAYDALLQAEQKAKTGGKGLHGNTGAPTRVVELSNDAAKAKSFLPFFLRGASNSRNEAVVEFVHSASKVKVYIPKQNCCLSLILVGVSTPKGNDPFAAEAQNWVKQQIHQKEVQVNIEALDKVGNFIGSLYFDENKNLSVELIKMGYASIRDERGSEYKTSEDAAKAAKLRIWENYKEPVAAEPAEDDEEGGDVAEGETKTNGDGPKKEPVETRTKVIITHVAPDLSKFSAQTVSSGPEFETLLSELREELAANPPLPGAFHANKGDIVAAKFSEDGEWYRARVEKPLGAAGAQVTFIDYGNKETVKSVDIAPLPSSKFQLSSFPAAAKEYSLAFVSLPEDPELVEDTRDVFQQDTANRELLLKSEYKDASTNGDYVTLYDTEGKKDIVLGLVQDGYFLVNLRDRRKERRLQNTITSYRQAQDAAKKSRVSFETNLYVTFSKL